MNQITLIKSDDIQERKMETNLSNNILQKILKQIISKLNPAIYEKDHLS